MARLICGTPNRYQHAGGGVTAAHHPGVIIGLDVPDGFKEIEVSVPLDGTETAAQYRTKVTDAAVAAAAAAGLTVARTDVVLPVYQRGN